jgi:hypothetical protein
VGVCHPETTVYKIQPGRGYEEAAAVLGDDFAGVLVRDGWPPYRRFPHAIHQTCLAHLLRRCLTLVRDQHESHFAPRVQTVLQRALRVRDRYRASEMSAHGVAVARGHLQNQLNVLIDHPGRRRVAQNFARHFRPGIPRGLYLPARARGDRRDQLARRACAPAGGRSLAKSVGGNRSWRGAHTQEVLASVLRTIQQRDLDAAVILAQLLQSPQPLAALAPPPAVQ